MTVVERFDVSLVPDHGRPRVLELRGPEGRLAVHCERESGALWLFAQGPRGGDRGDMVVPVRRAGLLAAWLAEADRQPFYSAGHGSLALNGDRVVVSMPGWTRSWRMQLDAAARDEFVLCLREWARAAEAVA